MRKNQMKSRRYIIPRAIKRSKFRNKIILVNILNFEHGLARAGVGVMVRGGAGVWARARFSLGLGLHRLRVRAGAG
eukprot:86939-Amorphochlora_amoeboformis.AAC.1